MTIKVFWQYLIPQHLLSHLIGRLARCRIVPIKNFLISIFIKFYRVDLTEAKEPYWRDYPNLQEFFVRELRTGVRKIAENPNVIISPVDGKISQIGVILQNTLLQTKNAYFTLSDLLAGDIKLAEQFQDGNFATIYLAPHNYHRVHMPFAGVLKKMLYVPGRLFSVNCTTCQRIPNLYARNERLIIIFHTEFGPMAVILVGALIVAGIETVWAGQVAPSKERKIKVFDYSEQQFKLERGSELGRFNFGSTVILLFPKKVMNWDKDMKADKKVCFGEELGVTS